jgi:hypothetical protein
VILLAGLACGAFACTRGAPDAQAPPTPSRVPGIVLICVDTLRADVTASGALPSLDAVAREGVMFTQASAPAAWTAPAVATMLTGLLPSHHGIAGSLLTGRLVSGVGTLAEALSARGWYTVAATGGGWISPEQGFHQGFDRFDVDFDAHGMTRARQFLAERPRDRPFFLFLHTLAPHDPYGDKHRPLLGDCRPQASIDGLAKDLAAALETPEGATGSVGPALFEDFMRVRLADPCGRVQLDRALGPVRLQRLGDRAMAWLDGGYRQAADGGEGVAGFLRTAYQAGMSHVDEVLRGTLQELDDLGLPPETVLVVTSDHGESLGEAGALYHGQRLHDAVVRVPLVVRARGLLPAGARVDASCGLVDLFPTLLDLAGLPAVAGRDGRSVLPLVGAEGSGYPVVAEAERLADEHGTIVQLLSVRTALATWTLTYDATAGTPIEETLETRPAGGGEASLRRLEEITDSGQAFCRAVTQARAELASRFGWPTQEAPCPAGP